MALLACLEPCRCLNHICDQILLRSSVICGSSSLRYEALAPADASAMTAEARMRLLSGLKRYFHSKRAEGLLSGQVGGIKSNTWTAAGCGTI